MGDDAADGDEEEKVDFWSMKFEEYLTEYVYNGAEPPDPEEGLDEEVERWDATKYKAMLDRLNTGSDVVYGRANPTPDAPPPADVAPQYRSADIGAVHVRDPTARVTGVKRASDEEILRIIKGGRFLGTSFSVNRCAGKDQLYFAAQKGREMIVRALLQPGADPFTEPAADINAPYGYDLTTPLYAACKNAHHGVVSILLQNRPPADINRSGRDGATPLKIASQHGHDVVVRLLLRFGADVDKRAKDGRTPLHAAAVGGHEPVVRALLRHGANPNAVDARGRTALHIAAELANTGMMKELVAAGANPDAKDGSGDTPLVIGWRGVVSALIEGGADVNKQDKEGTTPLDFGPLVTYGVGEC
uniref:Ankyrin repeat protein n=1 Tax=Micromonas pusilla TaxID=38833 RepID=A0A7S0NIE9_MICPS